MVIVLGSTIVSARHSSSKIAADSSSAPSVPPWSAGSAGLPIRLGENRIVVTSSSVPPAVGVSCASRPEELLEYDNAAEQAAPRSRRCAWPRRAARARSRCASRTAGGLGADHERADRRCDRILLVVVIRDGARECDVAGQLVAGRAARDVSSAVDLGRAQVIDAQIERGDRYPRGERRERPRLRARRRIEQRRDRTAVKVPLHRCRDYRRDPRDTAGRTPRCCAGDRPPACRAHGCRGSRRRSSASP